MLKRFTISILETGFKGITVRNSNVRDLFIINLVEKLICNKLFNDLDLATLSLNCFSWFF